MDIEMSECHRVVSNTDWLKARVDLLAKEKEFTKLRDELSQARRDLPWERVSENYVFDGPSGKASLGDYSRGEVNLLSIISCLLPNRKLAANTARGGQTTLSATSFTSINAT